MKIFPRPATRDQKSGRTDVGRKFLKTIVEFFLQRRADRSSLPLKQPFSSLDRHVHLSDWNFFP